MGKRNRAPLKERKSATDVLNFHQGYEFGGPLGALAIIIGSPIIVAYLAMCVKFNDGHAFVPYLGVIKSYLRDMLPSKVHVMHYAIFIAFQFFLALVLPGPVVKGHKLKLVTGVEQLSYKCNAQNSWFVTLALLPILHYTKIFDMKLVMENYTQYMFTAFGAGFAVSLITYAVTIIKKKGCRLSGNWIYDFFVGAPLNPRIGPVDLKIFAEVRISWVILFIISVSGLAYSYETESKLRLELVNLLVGTFLYANSCSKGETFIPATWDIVYEKWGFMVIFWNMAGVPFFYGLPVYYLAMSQAGRRVFLGKFTELALLITLIIVHALWDISNTQKAHFRQVQAGTYVKKKSIWMLPGSQLSNYKYLTTQEGSKILISGMWKYARKLHYTLDTIIMLTWAMNTGNQAFAPYFQPVFFIVMLLHRCARDERKLSLKYGNDWLEYKKVVPYRFIPYVY